MSEFVRIEAHGDVGVLRLDRPKVNALSSKVVSELWDACDELAAFRAVVVYGGEKIFSAGADLKEMGGGGGLGVQRRVRGLGDTISRLEALPVVTIAAVNGFALGGGCEIALGCDFRFVSPSAQFGQPEIVVGIIPGAGGTQRLPRVVGLGRAKWMVYTGEFVDAATAVSWGLADKICDDVFAGAMEQAERFAKGPTLALAAAKRAMQPDHGRGLEVEIQAFANLFQTEDTRIGLESFAKEGPGKAVYRGS